MNQQGGATITRAQELLDRWRRSCWDASADLGHLLAAKVPEARAAEPYPYMLQEWEAGYRRIIELDVQQAKERTVPPACA